MAAPKGNSIEILESIRPPRFLYIYRPINDYLHESLRTKTLWHANPLSFNDPFDCDLPVLFTGSRQEIIETTERVLARMQVSPETRNAARGAAANGIVYKADKLPEAVHKTMAQSGISCFTEVPNDILMWSHYAEKHQGLCLGFDASHCAWLREAKPITYSENFPLLRFVEYHLGMFLDLTYTKSSHWSYEKEWRYSHSGPFNGDDDHRRAIPFPAAALRRVIFGCRIAPGRLREVHALLNEWPTKLHLFQGARHRSKFQLSLHRVR